METNPPDPAARAQLARVRARLTSLVERRLQFGLTPDEEADYQRLAGVERELLRAIDESASAVGTARKSPTSEVRADGPRGEGADGGGGDDWGSPTA